MSANILNTVFYNVHKEQGHLDLARTSSEKAVNSQIFGKGFFQISRQNKLKMKTELLSYLLFSLFTLSDCIGLCRGLRS